MEIYKKLIGGILFISYMLVLLHSIIPHFHLDFHHTHETVSSDAQHRPNEHSHNHHHEHNSEENEDIDFFHSLEHLFEDGFHTHETQDHLAHIPTDHKVSLSKLKVYYADLLSFALPVNENFEKEKVLSFYPPPNERYLFTATLLRAPPALV